MSYEIVFVVLHTEFYYDIPKHSFTYYHAVSVTQDILPVNLYWHQVNNSYAKFHTFRSNSPVVLLRKMVAIRSFHGSWNRLSCISPYGDFGGVHFVSLCSWGWGMKTPFWKYLLSTVDCCGFSSSVVSSEKDWIEL